MVIEDKIVKSIVNLIEEKKISIPKIFCSEEYNDFEDEVSDALDEAGIEASFSQGASKFVIVPAESNYVIKIPFTFCGTEYEAQRYDPDSAEDMWWEPEDYNSHPFCYNYCEEEVNIRYETEDWEIEDAFSELEVVKLADSTQCLYIQEKVIPLCDLYDGNFTKVKSPIDISKDSEESYSKLNHYNSLNPTFVKAMIEFFGIDFVMQFENYLDTRGIGDLHDGNYGFRVSDNAPVIFDYGGYEE